METAFKLLDWITDALFVPTSRAYYLCSRYLTASKKSHIFFELVSQLSLRAYQFGSELKLPNKLRTSLVEKIEKAVLRGDMDWPTLEHLRAWADTYEQWFTDLPKLQKRLRKALYSKRLPRADGIAMGVNPGEIVAHVNEMERRIYLAKTNEFMSLAQEISSDHLAEGQKTFLKKVLLGRFMSFERSISDTLLFADKTGLTSTELYELYLHSLDLIKTPEEFLEILQKGQYIKGDKGQKLAFLSEAGKHLMKLKGLDLSHAAVSTRAKFLLELSDNSLQRGYLAKASSAKELADWLEFIQNMKKGGISLTLKFWGARFRESIPAMSPDDINLIAKKAKDTPELEAEILQYASGKPSPWYQRCLNRFF